MLSCEFCEIFRNTFFHRTSPEAASELKRIVLEKVNMKMTGKLSCEYLHDTPDRSDMNLTIFTAWKVFVFGFFLVRIQTKFGRIRTRKWTVLVISQVSQGGNCQQKQNNI